MIMGIYVRPRWKDCAPPGAEDRPGEARIRGADLGHVLSEESGQDPAYLAPGVC